jgi:hypothetical protein
LHHYHISTYEVETVFYGENHVFYPGNNISTIVGYTGTHMLAVDFVLDFEESLINIERLSIATVYEVNHFYCRRILQ